MKNHRFDLDAFIAWAESQMETSNDPFARFICKEYEMDNGNKMWKFRLRESCRDSCEDIMLIRGDSTDTIRFDFGVDTRQFHAHRRNLRFTDRTLKVMTDGSTACKPNTTICTAGTTTTHMRGPFPL